MKPLNLLLWILVCASLVTSAPAQTTTNSTNTIVRFTITGGDLIGTMDVELFDHDKPETVRNFLTYIQSGAYQNLFFHRCVPGFVLQAGAARVANPRSPALFGQYFPVPSFGAITNEFNAGPLLSNTYGTLAMAKRGGNPNSASTDWFFNLSNNSTNLDNQNGGFTVFGQVLTGTNVLEHFNSLGPFQGVLDLSLDFFYGPAAALFNALPVSFREFTLRLPRNIDLYYVQFKILHPRDVVRPTVTLKTPAANARVINETNFATGSAADRGGLAAVYYRLNEGDKLTASGTTNWSAPLQPPPGTNTLVVHSVDTAGNPSIFIKRTFFRVVKELLTLQIIGNGKVSGATNGQVLEIGRGYRLTATPSRGQLFIGWTGEIVSSSATILFLMQSNLTLQANFIANPFIPVKGTYNGLFFDTNSVRPEIAGFFTSTTTEPGRFTAKLQNGGRTYPFTGQFDLEGRAINLVPRAGTSALTVELQLDLTNGTQQITGRVIDQTGDAWLLANRAWFHAVTNKAIPLTGKYTLVIEGSDDTVGSPGGNGFGTATIDLAGNVLFTGTLADGTPVTQRVPVSKEGQWPFYASLYAGKGSAIGWITFTNRELDDLNGWLTWNKSNQPTMKYYPLGFTNDMIAAIGSRYTPPGTNRVLNVTNALVSFSGGNLAAPFTNNVTLTPPVKITNNTPNNRLTMTIVASSGLFSGSVTPQGTLRAIPFKGALLQKQTNGSGFFLGTDQSGRVTLE